MELLSEGGGGVPAMALVEFIDWGVPAVVGESSVLMLGDLRVEGGSVRGSAEWARLSCERCC